MGWSPWETLKDIGGGAKEVGKGLKDVFIDAPVGFVYDLAAWSGEASGSKWARQDRDGTSILGQRHQYDGGKFNEAVFGNLQTAMSGAGNVVGGLLPKQIEDPVSDVGAGIQKAGAAIDHVIAATFTSASIAEEKGGNPWNHWSEAWKVSKNRSSGQSFALMFGPDDVTDDEAVEKFLANDFVSLTAGVTDIVFAAKADPTVVVGKGKVAVSARYVTRTDGKLTIGQKTIRSQRDIDLAMGSGRVQAFERQVASIIDESPDKATAATRLHDRLFPDLPLGGRLSAALVDAGDDFNRSQVIRAALGDTDAIGRLDGRKAHLAEMMDKAADHRALEAFRDDGFDLKNSAERRTMAKAAVETEFADDLAAIDRDMSLMRTFREVPGPTLAREKIPIKRFADIRREAYWQKGPFGSVIRLANERPGWLVNLDDPTSEVQVARLMRVARMPETAAAKLRDEYVRAPNSLARENALVAAEKAVVDHIATSHGMTTEQLTTIHNKIADFRRSAAEAIQSRAYDADNNAIWEFTDDQGNITRRPVPVWVTQGANAVPMVDALALRQATTRIAKFKADNPRIGNLPHDMVKVFYDVWRPAVLLRAGYTLRNVGDEGLRMYAKMGAMVIAEEARAGTRNLIDKLHKQFNDDVQVGRNTGDVTVGDVTAEGAYGPKGAEPNIFWGAASSEGKLDLAQLGNIEEKVDRMLRGTGNFQTLTPAAPGYMEAWVRDVNLQISQDVVGRKILEGATPEQLVAWYKTPDGQSYLRKGDPAWAAQIERLADLQIDQVERYLPTENLRQLALERNVKPKDLEAEFPDAASRPNIHGEILSQTLGGGSRLSQTVASINEGLFRALGSMPQDKLIRHPFFDAVYRGETTRQLELLTDQFGDSIPISALKQVEDSSRQHALGQVKQYLYDSASTSEVAGRLRFISPFFGAFEDATKAWYSLAKERPDRVAKLYQASLAPERLGLVYDREGNRVGPRSDVPWSERYIVMRVPQFGADEWDSGAPIQGWALNKDAANFVMQGMPGGGPIVAVAANEIVKSNPELEESMKFLLPFGVQSNLDLLLPGAARDFVRSTDEDNRQKLALTNKIYAEMVVDFNLKKRKAKPTLDEAVEKANKVMLMRTGLRLLAPLPTTPTYFGAYTPYVEAFRKAQDWERDNPAKLGTNEDGTPRDAVEYFVDTYGEEYFALTVSVTKNNAGLPATIEGQKTFKKYKELLRKHPEYGSLLAGEEAFGADRSNAIYQEQFNTDIEPGVPMRQALTVTEFADKVDQANGWRKFRKAMAEVDAIRLARGYPNFQVKEARQLAAIRKAIIGKIGAEHESWRVDYENRDEGKWRKRIAALTEFTQTPGLMDRDDMRGVAEYLEMRRDFVNLLQSRKAKGINAKANTRLAVAWETATHRLATQNLLFAPVFYRWLEGDPLVPVEETP